MRVHRGLLFADGSQGKVSIITTLGVATYRVIEKVRFSVPPQERARCKSCLTPSTAYRGERQYKKQSSGELWPRKRCVSSCSGRVEQQKEETFVVRLRSNKQWDLARSHCILTTRISTLFQLFSYCELSKAIIKKFLLLRKKEKMTERGRGSPRGRGREMSSFLYSEHTMHVFLFLLSPFPSW